MDISEREFLLSAYPDRSIFVRRIAGKRLIAVCPEPNVRSVILYPWDELEANAPNWPATNPQVLGTLEAMESNGTCLVKSVIVAGRRYRIFYDPNQVDTPQRRGKPTNPERGLPLARRPRTFNVAPEMMWCLLEEAKMQGKSVNHVLNQILFDYFASLAEKENQMGTSADETTG